MDQLKRRQGWGESREDGREGKWERNFKNKERESKERVVDLWVKKFIEKEEKGMYEYNFYLTHPMCYSP